MIGKSSAYRCCTALPSSCRFKKTARRHSGAGTYDRVDFFLYGDPTPAAYGTLHDSEVNRPGFPKDLGCIGRIPLTCTLIEWCPLSFGVSLGGQVNRNSPLPTSPKSEPASSPTDSLSNPGHQVALKQVLQLVLRTIETIFLARYTHQSCYRW